MNADHRQARPVRPRPDHHGGPSTAIRVLVVDVHDGVRLGLTTALALADDLVVVGEARSGAEAIQLCQKLRPDVVLTEIQLPDGDGVALVQRIRQEFPETQVVVLTSQALDADRRRALAAGAHAYLQKYVAREELVATIRTVAAKPMASACHIPTQGAPPGRSR